MKNPNAIAKEAEPFLFEGPTAGQSLTNDPSNPYPWEKAPEMTSVKMATEKIFFDLLKDENLTTVATLMSQKTPVVDIANLLLQAGFQKGKWNPDDANVIIEDDEDESLQDLQNSRQQVRNVIPEGKGFKDVQIQKINPASVGGDIKKQLDTLDSAKIKQSILQKQKPALQNQESLLGKTGV